MIIIGIHKFVNAFFSEYNDFSNLFYVKNRSHPKVTFKWSSVDQVLLPALSGVVETYVL